MKQIINSKKSKVQLQKEEDEKKERVKLITGDFKLRASFGGGGAVGDSSEHFTVDYKLTIVGATGLGKVSTES